MKAERLQSEPASFAQDAGFHDTDARDAGKQSCKHTKTWRADQVTSQERTARETRQDGVNGGTQTITDRQRETQNEQNVPVLS